MGEIKGDYTIHNHGNEADLKMMIYGLLKPKWEGDAAENLYDAN